MDVYSNMAFDLSSQISKSDIDQRVKDAAEILDSELPEKPKQPPVVKDSVLLLVELLFVILKYFCLTNLSPTWTLN